MPRTVPAPDWPARCATSAEVAVHPLLGRMGGGLDAESVATSIVHPFSEDPSIARFEPHVPKTNPNQRPAIWAIDTEHAPLYWFPRNCPRVTACPRDPDERSEFRRRLATNAHRVHAIEATGLDRVDATQQYRYDVDASDFAPWPERRDNGSATKSSSQSQPPRWAIWLMPAMRLASSSCWCRTSAPWSSW